MDSSVRTAVIRDLGRMAYNMTPEAFRAALDLEDDAYAREKYAALKALGRAMAPLSDGVLAHLSEAYIARSLHPGLAPCKHCGADSVCCAHCYHNRRREEADAPTAAS